MMTRLTAVSFGWKAVLLHISLLGWFINFQTGGRWNSISSSNSSDAPQGTKTQSSHVVKKCIMIYHTHHTKIALSIKSSSCWDEATWFLILSLFFQDVNVIFFFWRKYMDVDLLWRARHNLHVFDKNGQEGICTIFLQAGFYLYVVTYIMFLRRLSQFFHNIIVWVSHDKILCDFEKERKLLCGQTLFSCFYEALYL